MNKKVLIGGIATILAGVAIYLLVNQQKKKSYARSGPNSVGEDWTVEDIPDLTGKVIIVTGANDLLTPEEVEIARPVIADAQMLVCQLEIPVDITLAALRIARQEGVTTIFNPAPARPNLPEELYQLSDIFCPNESETELLTNLPVNSQEEAETAARVLLERGAGQVILTLGNRGSLLVTCTRRKWAPKASRIASLPCCSPSTRTKAPVRPTWC